MNAKIDKFLGKKCCIWVSDSNYSFLDNRHMSIAKIIIQMLNQLNEEQTLHFDNQEYGKNGKITKKELFLVVKKEYDKRLDLVCSDYDNDPEKIIKTIYKFTITKFKNDWVKQYLGEEAFSFVLSNLRLNFIDIVEKGSEFNKSRGIHSFYLIRINNLGKELHKAWEAIENETQS